MNSQTIQELAHQKAAEVYDILKNENKHTNVEIITVRPVILAERFIGIDVVVNQNSIGFAGIHFSDLRKWIVNSCSLDPETGGLEFFLLEK